MDNKKQQNEDQPKIINEDPNAVGSPMNTGGKQGSEKQLKENAAGHGEQNGDVQAKDVTQVAGASRPHCGILRFHKHQQFQKKVRL